MSMSPDDPNFLQSLLGPNGSLSGSMSNPLMGLAAGLLQAGGPSRMPVSLGQALGQGLQTGQQFQSYGLQNAMQQLQLGKQAAFMNAMKNGSINDPNTLANLAAMSGDYGQASTIRSQAGWQPITDPNQLKQLVPGGAVPGQQYEYNSYTHDLKTIGDPAIKTVQIQGPNGTMVTVPWDSRTGKVIDVGGSLSPKDYSKPLNGSQEDYAQRVASYQVAPPTVSSRFPGAADISARADYLIKQAGGDGLDATTFPSKMAAQKSLAAGKDYQQNSAYSTIQTHMKTLDDAMAALDNGDVQGANKLTQWSGKQLGKSAPQNAKVVNDVVVGELAKVLAQGGQVTDAVRNEAAGDLEPYLSKGQYKGATDYIRQLIAGKMNTSYINARANKIPDDVFMAHLSPEARDQLMQFRQSHPDQFSGNQPTGASPAVNGSGNDPLGIR